MAGRSPGRRRVTLWVLFSMAVAAGICVSVAIFGGLNEPIRNVLEQGGQRILGGRLQIRQLEGNPLFRFQLSGVSWTTSGGDRIQLGEARIQYKPGWMLLGKFYIDSLIVVSPQVSLASSSGGDARVPVLPTMAIELVNIQHGVLVLDGEEKARDVSVTLGFEHGSDASRLTLRQMQSVVLDPPIEITNLDGIVLREDRRITINAVRLATAKSSGQVDGTITWGDPPRVDLFVRSDSRAAESPLTYLGIDAPQTDGWVSGTFSGPLDSLQVDFQWVAGGAAGEGQARGNVWQTPRRLQVEYVG